MNTTVRIEMRCGVYEQHGPECPLPDKLLAATEAKNWPVVRMLEPKVRNKVCPCVTRTPVPEDMDRRCSFEGVVDVEVSGPDGRGDWTCPRCLAAHCDEEV